MTDGTQTRRGRSVRRLLVTGTAAVLFAGLAVGVGAASASTPAGSWPGYLYGPQHTSYNAAATAITPSNSAKLVKAWTFKPSGTQSFIAGPAVVDGVVYIGASNGSFYALDQGTGAVLWSDAIGTVAKTTCSNQGFSSTAAVADDPVTGVETVYVASATGYLYALDAATGAVAWQSVIDLPSKTVNDYYIWSSPTLSKGNLYIGVASQCDDPLVPGSGLREYDQHTGAPTATFDTEAAGVIGGSIWSSAAAAGDGNVFVGTGPATPSDQFQGYADSIVALNGTTLAPLGSWQIPTSAAVGGDSDFGASPTLFSAVLPGGKGATALVGDCNKDGIFYALRQNDLAAGPVWQDQIGAAANNTNNDECLSSAVWNGKDLFMAGDPTTIDGTSYNGSIRELDPATGAVVWATGLPGDVDGSPSLDGSGVLSVGTFDFSGALNADYLVNASTGALLRTVKTSGSQMAAQPVFVGSDLLLATFFHGLIVYRAPNS